MTQYRFKYLLVAMILLLLVIPLVQISVIATHPLISRLAVTIVFAVMLLTAVFAVSKRRLTTIITSIMAGLIICLQALNFLLNNNSVQIAIYLLGIAFLAYIVILMIRFLFDSSLVTSNIIYASLCIYILLGVLWAFVYSLFDIVDPQSFTFSLAQDSSSGLMRFGSEQSVVPLYYSFVTMTTLGYGDIVPKSPLVRLLAAIQAVTGQLYIAVLVARLVGLHIVHSTKHEPDDKDS